MSLFLYRLGRRSYHRPWVAITVWVVLLGGIAAAIVAGGGVKISSSVTIDGTESQDVLDQLRTDLPAAAGGQGPIVFAVPAGQRLDTGSRAAAIGESATRISRLPFVVDPSSRQQPQPDNGATPEGQPAGQGGAGSPADVRPLHVAGQPVPGVAVSADGSVAMLQIQFTDQVENLPAGAVEQAVAIAGAQAGGSGVQALATDSLQPHEAPLGGHEIFGLGVAALVLFLTLGSLRAAGLPLINALTGVGVGLGAALALSHTITLTSATPVLALMVGLAVGIDYALFIVNRQRRLVLDHGLSAEEAASRAIGTAGSAVFFAGLTVVIALSGLTLIGISFLTTMALVAAVTVALTVVVALTLLPALLGLIGERIVTDRARNRARAHLTVEHRRVADRWARTVVRHRWPAIIGIVVVLGTAAIPLTSMSLGMPNGSTANHDTDERGAYDAITRGFGEGYNAPLVVVAHPGDGTTFDRQDLARTTAALQRTPDVRTASLMGADPEGRTAIFRVIPDAGPDAASTTALVDTLRAGGPQVVGTPGARLGVTGLTAVNLDISAKLAGVLPLYIAIVVVLSLIVLLLVFRSVVIPLKATLGFLLTLGATFGLMTAVFQWGWLGGVFDVHDPGAVLSFMPPLLIGILFGLAMDYQMFLVTSMREAHVHGHRGPEAIVHGFDQASRVVVAAAVIMVSVFAGFIFSTDPTIKQFGLALAVGILIDAFLVRMTFVPAVMAVLGDAAWWLPRRLACALPDLDVEGDQLAQHLSRSSTHPVPLRTAP
jgi:RND superfamily putative drug exporter